MASSDHFKKFMDSFDKKDSKKKERLKNYAETHADSPQRKYNKLYRERWQNRIIWRGNGNAKK